MTPPLPGSCRVYCCVTVNRASASPHASHTTAAGARVLKGVGVSAGPAPGRGGLNVSHRAMTPPPPARRGSSNTARGLRKTTEAGEVAAAEAVAAPPPPPPPPSHDQSGSASVFHARPGRGRVTSGRTRDAHRMSDAPPGPTHTYSAKRAQAAGAGAGAATAASPKQAAV